MSSKRTLFDGNSDDDDGEGKLTINKNYADHYDKWRELELKQKLSDKYKGEDHDLSNSSSESSTDEEEVEELKKVLNKDFFEVISSLKTRDPKIYNKDVQFFRNEKASDGFDPLARKEKKKSKDKPLFLRDYERKLITERGGKLSDDDSDDEGNQKRPPSPSYVEEQQQIKESIKKAIVDDESDEEEGLLMKKEKTAEQRIKEEVDYIEWLKGEKEALPDKETEKSLKPLQNLWSDPKLDDNEKFLRDYILNKRYLEEDNSAPDAGNVTDEDLQDDEMEKFEHKFNFRFEEPDREFLKRYPRTMEQSLRKKDTRRKEKREAVKQRKEEEKQRKKEELKLLKSLKRKEIMEKIEKIKAITGNDQLGLNAEELEEDFDPEEHDRKMKELFNDDYYEGAEDAEDEDELNLPPLEEELMDDHVNWDEWDGTDQNNGNEEENADDIREGDAPYCEDPDFNMDCDFDPATESLRLEEKAAGRQSAREKRKLKRQSRFGRLVRREKPVFDPKDKTFEQYVDEYYGMDYEDLIGDIPCRYKYRTVVPNSFGLTIEEILAADDKELNQWASIRKAYMIRPDYVEKNEAKMFAQRAQNEALKRKILPSLYRYENENDNLNNNEENKKKKKKMKRHSEGDVDGGDISSVGQMAENCSSKGSEEKKKKKKKKDKHVENETSTFETGSMDPIMMNEDESEMKKTKKKKKKHYEACDNDNPSLNPVDAGSTENSSLGQSLEIDDPNHSTEKKKKKKKNEGKINEASMVGNPGDIEESKTENRKRKQEEGVEFNHVNKKARTDEPKKIANKGSEGKKNFNQRNGLKNTNQNNGLKKSFDKGNGPRKNFNQGNGQRKNFKNFNQSEGPRKNVKKWNKSPDKGKNNHTEMSDERLKAYGLHPKRYKNYLKYGHQN